MKPYYQDDVVTVYHGDCRDILPGLSAELVLTDPPYNAGKNYGIYNDNMSIKKYQEFMRQVVKLSLAAASHQAWVVPRYKLDFFLPLFSGYHLVIIRRGAAGPFRQGWSDQFEVAITIGKPSSCVSDLWDDIRLKGEGYFFREDTFGHPGYTPYPLMRRLAGLLADKTLIDPFCGTGTALRAAKDLNIHAIGIELNERYCEISAKRMAQEVLDLKKS